MMQPTLLVLAAGMGSRYGGLKQMDGVGPHGEIIMDYSINDAIRAGFGKVVFVIRHSFEQEFKAKINAEHFGNRIQVEYVFQELDYLPEGFEVPAGREKPWGTNHAILMAKDAIHEPFAVINGDDYYGKESFRVLGDWCRAHEDSEGRYCIIGFELDNTLSESGGVSRGICHYDGARRLTAIEEHLNIALEADGKVYGDNSVNGDLHVELDRKALCSMNMWGFTPDYFAKSEAIFEAFLEKNISELKKEYYIPYAVDCMIKDGSASCDVLSTPSRWFGVTYKEDRPGVVAKFAELVKEGVYPSPLY